MEGKDVQWRRKREGQAGKGGREGEETRLEVVTTCNKRRQEKVGKGFCVEQSFIMQNK